MGKRLVSGARVFSSALAMTFNKTSTARSLFAAAAGSLILVGCFQQPLPDLSALPEAPGDFPQQKYQQLTADGWTVVGIDPLRSMVQARVYKTGRLARLGHNHIVSSQQLQGWVAIRDGLLTADLFIRLDQLEVDRSDLRATAGAGFESVPDADDIAGTRANMLSDKVMHATEFPFVEITVPEYRLGDATLELTIGLRGNRQNHVVTLEQPPVAWTSSVSGEIEDLSLTAFAVPRFSILGGAIGVAETVDVSFVLAAKVPD